MKALKFKGIPIYRSSICTRIYSSHIKQGIRIMYKVGDLTHHIWDIGHFNGNFIDAVDSGAHLQRTPRRWPRTQVVPVLVQLQYGRDPEQSFQIG